MGGRSYFCDYCNTMFKNTRANRKQHEQSIEHQQAKDRWYDSFKLEEEEQQQQQQQQHQPPPPPQLLPNTPPSEGFLKPLCYNFINTGICSYGDSCEYFHPSANDIRHPTISTQPIISTLTTPGSGIQDNVKVTWDHLPPSLQPPPENGYDPLPFVDWG